MNAKSVVLEVQTPEQEALLRQFHAYVMEMNELALAAPEGKVLDDCEQAAWARGQEVNREVLQQAVQRRIDAAEKKGRRCDSVDAAKHEKTAGPRRAES